VAVVKLPKMTKQEIWKLIRRQRLCRIAFKGEDYPYFHFTDYGKKMRLIENDNRVCVEIEEYKEDLSEYRFIVLMGTINVVTNPQERVKAIKKLAKDGEQKLSPCFLPAHGFKREDGWSSLNPTNPSLIAVKLETIKQEIGLKSP
jgi:nitroimidazol reductase NimA-like FMN-containing flavoprotein (pyridoxamine 5'-phosphate oxidase superfamily)